jgi:hypothetical protein
MTHQLEASAAVLAVYFIVRERERERERRRGERRGGLDVFSLPSLPLCD